MRVIFLKITICSKLARAKTMVQDGWVRAVLAQLLCFRGSEGGGESCTFGLNYRPQGVKIPSEPASGRAKKSSTTSEGTL